MQNNALTFTFYFWYSSTFKNEYLYTFTQVKIFTLLCTLSTSGYSLPN